MSSLCINQCSSKVCTTLFLVVCFLILLGHSDAFRSGTHVRKGRKKTKRTQQVSDTQHHRKLRKVPKYCSPDKLNYDLIFSGTSEYYEKESTKKWTNVCIRWYLSTTPTEAPIMTPDLNGTSSPSLSPSSNPTTSEPTTEPTMIPTFEPSFSPSRYPTLNPSLPPSLRPTLVPSIAPTRKPTSAPSAEPSSMPSTPKPTKEPTEGPSSYPTISMPPTKNPSYEPTNTQYTVILQPVKFELFFTGRRLNGRTLEEMNENTLRETLRSVITDCMETNFSNEGFHSVQMVLNQLESNANKSSYKIGGSMVFDTMDVTNIPDDISILDKMLIALASTDTKAKLGGNIVDISASSYSSSTFNSVQNAKENDTETISAQTDKITYAAVAVALASTVAAIGLIFQQRRKMNGEESVDEDIEPVSPSKVNPLALRHLSPFSLSPSNTPGAKKYFCKLDDDGQNDNIRKNGLPSYVSSNPIYQDDSSLEAPSMASMMTGLNSTTERSRMGESTDGESLTNMSAMDEVRLSSVLQIEDGSLLADTSLNNSSGQSRARKKAFSRLWRGSPLKKINSKRSIQSSKSKSPIPKKKASPIHIKRKQITTSKTDAEVPPTLSPLTAYNTVPITSELYPGEEKFMNCEDSVGSNSNADRSLLGDQSIKDEFYGQEDSNLYYNMLGERSEEDSFETDSLDINEMFGLGSTSSSILSGEIASNLEEVTLKMEAKMEACNEDEREEHFDIK